MLGGGEYAANCQTEREQRQKAVDQERLALISIAKVRPGKWQDKDSRNSIQIVNGSRNRYTGSKKGDPRRYLRDNQYFSDNQRARITTRETPSPQIGDDAPNPERRHV